MLLPLASVDGRTPDKQLDHQPVDNGDTDADADANADDNEDDNNDDNLGESFVSDRLIAVVASETIRVPGGAQRLIMLFKTGL